jgi:hypothetical protein
VTIVDAFLRERSSELASTKLPLADDWFTVLVTPWWQTSRHVIALVHARRDGELRLVVKLPRRPGDEGGIENEARALRRLEALTGDPPAPRLLALTQFHSQSLLVESAVTGRPLSPELVRADPERATQLVAAFVRALPQTAAAGEDSDLFVRLLQEPLRQLIDAVGGWSPLRELAARTLPLLAPLDSTPMPLVFQHGDPSHPNLVLRDDGTLAAVDWERAEERALPLHDLTFALQYLGEARASVFDPVGRCGVFDTTFLSPNGVGRSVLLLELERLGLTRELLAPLVLATWVRAATSLVGRLWSSSATGSSVPAETGARALEADRDFALWRHVVTRMDELLAL